MYKTILLLLVLVTSLASCGSKNSVGGATSTTEVASSSQESQAQGADQFLSAPSREVQDVINQDFNSLNNEIGNF